MPKQFFCIGGPFHMQRKTWAEVEKFKKYYQFNNAGGAPVSCIFVWFDGLVGQ